MYDPFLAEEAAFRDEVLDYVRTRLPEHIRRKQRDHQDLTREELTEWTLILNERGWGAPHWPVEWGGTGWSPLRRQVFLDTLQAEHAPDTLSFGTSMVGPVICAFGSEEQKRRFLPRILTLEDWWCQGFSEPDAGSDLASLRTSAVRRGDRYIVNGQKTWTTLGQYADWIFCLVRTDTNAKPQAGISFLLIDMRSAGISLRPIRTIDGGYEVNDVFFDEVEVPVENLVGEENKGWNYAKFLLGNERTGIARVGLSRALLRRVREWVSSARDSAALNRIRDRMLRLEVELRALEVTQMRILAGAPELGGSAASILKLRGSELQQNISRLMLDIAGSAAIGATSPVSPDWSATIADTFLNWRKVSIYGGSNEVQRSLIARQVLGGQLGRGMGR
ncbi:acyl-CoA dehydrogenase family protein [Microvirga pakistanensis]|uniref:acyl-CoA dehydrogenase family protein n=1 Tax=Microvirga pakistanensis TaxID=1682650 RepID=UPI00106ABF46|nr:acyl-CoA dehydrogenase family protein [Microvirga pakistanensis]